MDDQRRNPVKPLVVCFATPGEYEAHMAKMVASATSHQLDVYTEVIPATSEGWIGNCLHKGPFVLRALKQFKQPVLWVDADAVIRHPVEFLYDAEFDFAAYWKKKGQWNDNAIMSGTVFFNTTPAAVALCEYWAHLCETVRGRWDQKLLSRACREKKGEYTYADLPQGYCKVFDRAWRSGEHPYAVIEHNQASRTLKHNV